jgi:hypothetical protein
MPTGSVLGKGFPRCSSGDLGVSFHHFEHALPDARHAFPCLAAFVRHVQFSLLQSRTHTGIALKLKFQPCTQSSHAGRRVV